MDDVAAEGLAFVELAAERREVFVEELVHVSLRLGVEEDFLRSKAVQPFGVPLDVPVQVVARWLEELPGAKVLGVAESAVGASFALNENVRRARREADRTEDDRTYRVYSVEASLLATSPGELRIPGPVLLLAYATRFRESLFDDRVPLDRVDASVRGAPLVLDVRPLPEDGRPWEFTGAVGHFTVRANVASHEILADESLKLALTIEGEGNLGSFEAPAPREIGAFRVLGMLDEKTPDARILTYDLAPYSDKVWQVPAIPFAYFDPGPPSGYREARTEPIDVVVRAAPRAPRAPSRTAPENEPVRTGPWILGALGLVVLALAVFLVARR